MSSDEVVPASCKSDLREVLDSLRQLFRDGVFAGVLVLLLTADAHEAKPEGDGVDA
jgi:hypothetical protein